MDAKELAEAARAAEQRKQYRPIPTHTAHGAAEGRSRGGAAGRAQAAAAISVTASTIERSMLPITQDYRLVRGALVGSTFGRERSPGL